jgi:hypothetical protein
MKNPYIKMSTPWIFFEIFNKGNLSNKRIENILKTIKRNGGLGNCRSGCTGYDEHLKKVGFFIWRFYILKDYSRIFYNDRYSNPFYKRISKKKFKQIVKEQIEIHRAFVVKFEDLKKVIK